MQWFELKSKDQKAITTFREIIQHEDTVREGRVNWLIFSQTMLLTAFSTLYEKEAAQEHLILFMVICLFGIFSALSVRASLVEGRKATRNIKEEWNKFLKARGFEETSWYPVWGHRHDADTSKEPIDDHDMVPHHFFPAACVTLWLVIAMYTIFHQTT